MLSKCQVKKLGFWRLRDLLKSGKQIKVFGTFYLTDLTTIRSGKGKKCWKNIGETRNDK